MKIFIILILGVQQCIAIDIPRADCQSDITLDKEHYNITNTYNVGDAYPTDAHYDTYGNLFFVESGRRVDGYYFDINIIPANTTTVRRVPGLPDGVSYSIAVDKKQEKVYFGTGKGIYKYNYDTEDATLVYEPEGILNNIFVDKDSNKYITESFNGIEELYLLAGDKKIRFKTLEALNELAIDSKNNFYFIKDEKLFVLKSTLSKPTLIGNVSYDGLAQISFHKEMVYVASENLTYFHENDTGALKLVTNTPGNVTAIAFNDIGNFMIGIYGKLMEYKKNECYIRRNHHG